LSTCSAQLIHLYEVLDVPLTDSLFMVLEFCPGGTLLDLPCRQKPPMSASRARSYLAQLIMGLEYLHSNGVIHRDIKPENILLSMDSETAKFCDFGVSEMFSRSGDSKVAKENGSPAFIPPECTVGAYLPLFFPL
jgi:[calcium/calmodulin-dependent protein kinase] kinase